MYELKNNSEVFKKIISILNNEFLDHRKIICERRGKIFKTVNLNESDSIETVEFKNSFKGVLINKGILSEWAKLEYKEKIKVLEKWWNEKIKSSLEKRSEIFTENSAFYKSINEILNSKNERVNPKTKQVNVEKWIMDYESYKIRDLIEQNELVKSTEAKIYSNLFKLFEREWDFMFSSMSINDYRKLKKEFNEKKSIRVSIKTSFMLLCLGSINTFSLGLKILMDTIYS